MTDFLREHLDDTARSLVSEQAFHWAGTLPPVIATYGWQLYGLACVALAAAAMASYAVWRAP